MDIFIKNAAKVRTLEDIARAYKELYPAKFEFIRNGLRQLREVTVSRRTDVKGRDVEVTMRVPSEPFLFAQAIMPGFGEDSDDITLLCRVWDEMAVATNDRRKKSHMVVETNLKP